MPTSSATMIVLGSSSRPLFGSVNPTASNNANSPFASASPRKSPIDRGEDADDRRLDQHARSTWRRDAPSVRRVANSRVRCAIVIDSEFAITNAPTKRAMPPKASRKDWRKLVKAFVSLASSCAWFSPLRTCVPGGRIARIDSSNCAR